MSASAKSDTPSMEVIREPQTKEEWEQAYIAVLKRAHDAERELTTALAEAEALRKDAGRWQRFKTLVNPVHFCQYMCWHPKDAKLFADIDAAIDAARSTEGKK